MNWDQIEGNLTERRGRFAEKWGEFTDDDRTAIGGKRDRFAGLLQQRDGIAKEHVEKQIAVTKPKHHNDGVHQIGEPPPATSALI